MSEIKISILYPGAYSTQSIEQYWCNDVPFHYIQYSSVLYNI